MKKLQSLFYVAKIRRRPSCLRADRRQSTADLAWKETTLGSPFEPHRRSPFSEDGTCTAGGPMLDMDDDDESGDRSPVMSRPPNSITADRYTCSAHDRTRSQRRQPTAVGPSVTRVPRRVDPRAGSGSSVDRRHDRACMTTGLVRWTVARRGLQNAAVGLDRACMCVGGLSAGMSCEVHDLAAADAGCRPRARLCRTPFRLMQDASSP